MPCVTSIYGALASSTTPNAISKRVSKPRVTPDSYHSTLSLRDNHVRVFSSRVTPNSYHSTLGLRDNLTVCFHLESLPTPIRSTLTLHPREEHLYLASLKALTSKPKSNVVSSMTIRPRSQLLTTRWLSTHPCQA